MNWTQINKKYPKATKKAFNWRSFLKEHERDLYDFFDEQKIFIEISLFCATNFKNWCYDIIFSGSLFSDFVETHINSRKEAEQQAFEKAFEILERQL